MNETLATTESAIALIVQNMAAQLIAFQNAISAREAGLQFPDQKEVATLVKLINCLHKLQKLLQPAKTNLALSNFLAFLQKADPALGKTVAQQFKIFSASQNTMSNVVPTSDNTNLPRPPHPQEDINGLSQQREALADTAATSGERHDTTKNYPLKIETNPIPPPQGRESSVHVAMPSPPKKQGNPAKNLRVFRSYR